MYILLKCQYSSGSAAFAAGLVEALPAPQRRYEIVDGTMILDGYDDAILHHDANELLKSPIYRMPTPQEMDAYTASQQAAVSVAESAPVDVPTPKVVKAKVNNEG